MAHLSNNCGCSSVNTGIRTIYKHIHVCIVVRVGSGVFSIVIGGVVLVDIGLRSCFLILGGYRCLNSSCIILCRCCIALTRCRGLILYIHVLSDFDDGEVSSWSLGLRFLLSLLALGWRSLLGCCGLLVLCR